MGKKIAIIQDVVGGGGRFTVLAEIIDLLNKREITPVLIVREIYLSEKEIKEKYQKTLKYKIEKIPVIQTKKLYEFDILMFNFKAHFYLKKFDYIIETNNSQCLLKTNRKLLSYVHYPRKDRVLRFKNLHVTNKENLKLITKIGKLMDFCLCYPFYIIQKLKRNNTIIANSEFTKNAIINRYKSTDIDVIYPPVSIVDFSKNLGLPKEEAIVTIGAYSEVKGQFEQIKLAKQLPELKFFIIGFADINSKYFKKCKDYVLSNNIENVELLPNIDYKEMILKLNTSKYFLHTLWNEPFGITTVQAIAAGCIPIVPNSGGQKEIVNYKELRFDSIVEVPTIIDNIKNIDFNKLLVALRKNIELYSSESFKLKLAKKLDTFLN